MKSYLETSRLILRNPKVGDELQLRQFYERNAAHLSPWETVSDMLSKTEQELVDVMKLWETECELGTATRFLIFRKDNDKNELIGMCNFTQISYGYFKACYLGYKLDHEHQGKGHMFEALSRSMQFIFDDVGLHRVMANYVPENHRSANLLYRLGFQIEGYAQNYLMINNRWEDHVLTALSHERWSSLQEINRGNNRI